MLIKINKEDIIWSYTSQIFQFGSGIFILPMILKKLPTEEVGIWYVFLSVTALVNLLDFGFQPTITRNVSYVFSGVKKLIKNGISSEEIFDKTVDFLLLKSLIKTIKKIYRIISCFAFIILITAGTIYINSIIKNISNKNEIMIAWTIYILASCVSLYFYYYTPLLLGRGLIKELHKTIVISRSFYMIFSITALGFGYGLIAVAGANLISSFISSCIAFMYFYDKDIKNNFTNIKNKKTQDLSSILWSNSFKIGLVSLGTFLILRVNTLLVAKFLDLKIVASYGLTLQIFTMLVQCSMILFNTYMPLFNNFRIKNQIEELKQKYSETYIVLLITFLIGMIIIIFSGNSILNYIGSKTLLLDKSYLLFMGIILLLELNHSIAASLITTKNEVPFVKPALISGIAIGIISFLLLKYTKLGIFGILLSQFIVQLSYNNWKWPIEILKDLKTNYIEILKMGIDNVVLKVTRGAKNDR